MSIATPTRPASPADITAPLETAYLRPSRTGFEAHFAALDALPLVSPLPEPRAMSSEYWATYERLCGGVAELCWRVRWCSGRIAKEIDDCVIDSVTVAGESIGTDMVTDEMLERALDSADYDAMRAAG